MRLLLIGTWVSCARGPSTPPEGASSPPPPTEVAPTRPEACPMLDFPPHISAAREAVLRNDSAVLRRELGWMAAAPGLPVGLRPPVTPEEAAAASPEESDESRAAAVFLGELGMRCGACHQGAGPKFPEVPRPVSAVGVAPHMQRNLWTLDRMWEGLLGPSDARWSDGVALLAGADLDPALFAGREAGQQSPAGDLAPWLKKIGETALQTPDLEARARLYGDLLATCAECHQGSVGAPSPQRPL